MADTWPPPLPTYTNDIGGNIANSAGWALETLFWPVLGLDAQPTYSNNGSLPNNSPTEGFWARIAKAYYGAKPQAARAADTPGIGVTTVLTGSVLAAIVAVSFLMIKKGK